MREVTPNQVELSAAMSPFTRRRLLDALRTGTPVRMHGEDFMVVAFNDSGDGWPTFQLERAGSS